MSISVKTRIAIIVLLSIFCILLSVTFNSIQFSKVNELTDKIYKHPVTVSRAVSTIELNIALIHREMKDIALGKELSTGEKIVNHLHEDTLKQIDILSQRFLGDQGDIKRLKNLFIDWKPIRQKVFHYRSLNRSDLAYNITTTEGVEHTTMLNDVVHSIKNFAEKKLEQFYADSNLEAYKSITIAIIITLVAIFLFLVTSYFVAKSINLQLRKLSHFSKQVAEGDLLSELETNGNSEIDQLGYDLLQMKESLKRLIIKNQTTNKQLLESEKLATLGGLVAGVAHEMNTPLGISITATSVIKEIRDELKRSFDNQELTTDQFEILMEKLTVSSNLLDENINKGARIIHDFRLTAVDQITDNKCSFNLKEILKALLSSLYPETRKVPVIPVLAGNDEIMMNSLPGTITQIISNLVVNSVKHAFYDQQEPEIDISFRDSGRNIILEYRDNGCGIDASEHKKIFEPFYTTGPSRHGKGLGLNLVKSLIQDRLHGSMNFTSSKGQGVHFVFTIPMELPNEETEDEEEEK